MLGPLFFCQLQDISCAHFPLGKVKPQKFVIVRYMGLVLPTNLIRFVYVFEAGRGVCMCEGGYSHAEVTFILYRG